MTDVLELSPDQPLEAVRYARDRLAQGDPAEAERVARWALDHHPAHAGLLIVLARATAQQGDLETALACTDQAIARHPKDVAARLAHGDLLLQRHDTDGAAAAFQQALDLAPGDANAARRLSAIAARRGDMETAIELAQRAVQARPGTGQYLHLSALLLQTGRWQEAEEVTRAGLDHSPDHPALLRRLSDALFRRGDMAAALEIAERAIAEHPAAGAYTYLANWHMQFGNLHAAGALLAAALKAAPNDAIVLRRSAELALRKNDAAAARGFLQQAIELRPAEPAAYEDLATLLLQQGDAEQAGAVLQDGLAHAPGDPGLTRRLAYLQSLPPESLPPRPGAAPVPDDAGRTRRRSLFLGLGRRT